MTLRVDAKLKGKLTRGLKNNIRNLINFHTSSQKSENLHFDGVLLFKAYKKNGIGNGATWGNAKHKVEKFHPEKSSYIFSKNLTLNKLLILSKEAP